MNSKMMKITKTADDDDDQASSAVIVASIDDLLIKILLRLPIRSLIRFKFVSKHWLSLITTPKFSLLRNPDPNPAIGMFVPPADSRANHRFHYVHFDTKNPSSPPFQELEFQILQSCNGLLLCSSFQAPDESTFTFKYYTYNPAAKYCVYNPTTKQHTTLPNLSSRTSNSRTIHGVNLAFEPSMSPHYKVVCVWSSDLTHHLYQIEIYSSETGDWRISGEPFDTYIDFSTGIYWNGSIHWINYKLDETFDEEMYTTSVYYDIEHEKLGRIRMPPGEEISLEHKKFVAYFGESCDHLHYINRFQPEIQFNVYEMKRDFSGWFVKYEVDLTPITIDFPEMVTDDKYNEWMKYYEFSIFTLVRGKDDADSFLVLQIPGKTIRYNITSNTFEILHDIDGIELDGTDIGYYSAVPTRKAAEYIESLC